MSYRETEKDISLSVRKTADQIVPAGGFVSELTNWTIIPSDGDYDNSLAFNFANGVFSAPCSGKYALSFETTATVQPGYFPTNATAFVLHKTDSVTQLTTNVRTVFLAQAGKGTNELGTATMATDIFLNANDRLQLLVINFSQVLSITISGATTSSFLTTQLSIRFLRLAKQENFLCSTPVALQNAHLVSKQARVVPA